VQAFWQGSLPSFRRPWTPPLLFHFSPCLPSAAQVPGRGQSGGAAYTQTQCQQGQGRAYSHGQIYRGGLGRLLRLVAILVRRLFLCTLLCCNGLRPRKTARRRRICCCRWLFRRHYRSGGPCPSSTLSRRALPPTAPRSEAPPSARRRTRCVASTQCPLQRRSTPRCAPSTAAHQETDARRIAGPRRCAPSASKTPSRRLCLLPLARSPDPLRRALTILRFFSSSSAASLKGPDCCARPTTSQH